jgi:hypothetical protein
MIDAGTDFYYDLNATDYSGLDQWWINDTQNFAIDSEGVVTNNTQLAEGEYALRVGVNDTLGNTRHGTFVLTVNPPPMGEPEFPIELVAVAGGFVIILLALVIWRNRR